MYSYVSFPLCGQNVVRTLMVEFHFLTASFASGLRKGFFLLGTMVFQFCSGLQYPTGLHYPTGLQFCTGPVLQLSSQLLFLQKCYINPQYISFSYNATTARGHVTSLDVIFVRKMYDNEQFLKVSQSLFLIRYFILFLWLSKQPRYLEVRLRSYAVFLHQTSLFLSSALRLMSSRSKS